MPARIRNIDVLRGIAILAVIELHAFHYGGVNAFLGLPSFLRAVLRCGWAGVDLFFVLSAYLLTSNLLRNRTADGLAFTFYKRRALRILPLYWAVLAVGFALATVWDLIGGAPNSFLFGGRHSLLTYLVFAQNWVEGWNSGRPAQFFGVTWSLAVEEHLYLVLPLFAPRLSARALGAVAIAWILLAPAIRYEAANLGYSNGAYVWTIGRLDAFGVGILIALCAVYRENLIQRAPPALFAAMAVAIVAILSQVAPDAQASPFAAAAGPTLATLAAFCMIVAGLAAAQRSPGRGAGAVGSALAWCGERCFSLYLLHLPVLGGVFACLDLEGSAPYVYGSYGGLALILIGCGATFAIAAMTFRHIETPFIELAGTLAPYRRRASVVAAHPVIDGADVCNGEACAHEHCACRTRRALAA
ncbi:MAG: acyltransferase [Hyphomicrobiales bacterium]|nr:acyltransferase [Hyphomicrobiales bacterium]